MDVLTQWEEGNPQDSLPYDNSSLERIDYSCDLYGLGCAFEEAMNFCHDQDEVWDLVINDFYLIIDELKRYDNGIPAQSPDVPHLQWTKRLDALIAKVIEYENSNGFNPSAIYATVRFTDCQPVNTAMSSGVMPVQETKIPSKEQEATDTTDATDATDIASADETKSQAKKPSYKKWMVISALLIVAFIFFNMGESKNQTLKIWTLTKSVFLRHCLVEI